MITLHAFGNMFPGGVGETKDMWVQWGLEEMGVAYEVRAWDYLGGETQAPGFERLSPFGQLPALEHDGQALTESAAILLHVARSCGRLIPDDEAGRSEVTRWCFAAQATLAWPIVTLAMVDAGFMGQAPEARPFAYGLAERMLDGLERRLEGRTWIATDDFTVADIVTAGVLREARHTDLFEPRPAVAAYFRKAMARPAWARTRTLYGERLGVDAETLD